MGKDISCNLGLPNIAAAIDLADFGKIDRYIDPGADRRIRHEFYLVGAVDRKGQRRQSCVIGLGQMNLHGYLARERIFYGSEEGVDFTNIYFYTVTYHAIARPIGSRWNAVVIESWELENSKCASGEYFDKYIEQVLEPVTDKVQALFDTAGIHIPTQEDWLKLKEEVITSGLYNQNLQAVPPTGSDLATSTTPRP